MLKVKCRGIWLCKLTYPVIYRLTVNRSDLRQTITLLNIIEKQLPSISAISPTIFETTWSLSSVLTLHRSVQLKLNSDVKQITASASAKQNSIRWCQQRNKPGAIGRIERDLFKCYELRKNYVKNTQLASVPRPWIKSRQANIQTKNTKTQNSNFRYHDSEQAAEIWPNMTKLNWMMNKHQMYPK